MLLGGLGGFFAAIFRIGRYTKTVDTLEKNVERVEGEIKAMSTKITQCETKIDERTQWLSSKLTRTKSPISLSEFGEGLLKRSGSDAFVLMNQEELVQQIRDRNPKSAYDIQEFSKTVVKSLADEERFIPFKDFAFKEGVDLDAIFIVMSLYLRDIALPLLDYKPEDVDQSTPTDLLHLT